MKCWCDEVKSKQWIWLDLVSFRNISSIFPVWRNKNALAKAYVAKADYDSVTQFLRHLVTNRRCKFLLEDTSCPDRWLNCPLHESRECHASDTGDMSPQNKQTQIWAWHLIYHCGTERSRNWKFNWLKGQREEFPLNAEAARFLSFDVMSLVWLFFIIITIVSLIWRGNRSIQALYEQKSLDQIELRWVHPMPRRITSVCSASTNTWLLLCCTFHSECPDLSL